MRKNIILIVLCLILLVVTCVCINAYLKLSIIERQLNKNNNEKKGSITLYKNEESIYYYLLSDDDNLIIYFEYDELGLKRSFGVNDSLSGKNFGFNFYEKENLLTSFTYSDNNYHISTNLYIVSEYIDYPDIFIERLERINDLETLYYLKSDGTVEVKIEEY